MNKKIVLLAGQGESTSILYNSICRNNNIVNVIVENPVPMHKFLYRRVKKLGVFTVLGQVLFVTFVSRILKMTSKKRKLDIMTMYSLDNSNINPDMITHVESVNSEETQQHLKTINPKIVLVNGTRIISKKTLECIPAKFINIHAGITPLYRGVHGVYWALINGDIDSAGVTVHLVDQGIDTGNILAQGQVTPERSDNFITYPLSQLAEGIDLLVPLLSDILDDKIQILPTPKGKSCLWYHPTFWGYLWNRWKYGVK